MRASPDAGSLPLLPMTIKLVCARSGIGPGRKCSGRRCTGRAWSRCSRGAGQKAVSQGIRNQVEAARDALDIRVEAKLLDSDLVEPAGRCPASFGAARLPRRPGRVVRPHGVLSDFRSAMSDGTPRGLPRRWLRNTRRCRARTPLPSERFENVRQADSDRLAHAP